MDERIKFSLVIPAYNEVDGLEALHARLSPVLDGLDGRSEVIFINDGSDDGTKEVLEDIAARDERVVVINLTRNFGQHPAVTAGILETKGEYIITLDADLQNPPEEIPRLIEELDKGYDMVSGRRRNRRDSIFRKVPSFAVSAIISSTTGVWMRDYGTMLRVFKADTAKKLAAAYIEKQAYITMLIPGVTKKVKEIDVLHDERASGCSKYGFFRLVSTFMRIFSPAKKSEKNGGPSSSVFTIDSVVRARDQG